jgi:hypothetical protein
VIGLRLDDHITSECHAIVLFKHLVDFDKAPYDCRVISLKKRAFASFRRKPPKRRWQEKCFECNDTFSRKTHLKAAKSEN